MATYSLVYCFKKGQLQKKFSATIEAELRDWKKNQNKSQNRFVFDI